MIKQVKEKYGFEVTYKNGNRRHYKCSKEKLPNTVKEFLRNPVASHCCYTELENEDITCFFTEEFDCEDEQYHTIYFI